MLNELYINAEATVLGALMIDPDCVAEIFLDIAADDFIDEDYRLIYRTAQSLFADGTPITPVTIGAKTSPEILRLCNDCVNLTPTSASWPGYAKVLSDCAAAYRAQNIIEEMRLDLQNGSERAALQAQAEQLLGVLSIGRDRRTFAMTDLLTRFFERIGRKRIYLDWGFDKLNAHLFVERRAYVILAARPSIGKTALALQIAMHMARTKRVIYFGLETDEDETVERIMTAQSGVDYRSILTSDLQPEQLADLARAKTPLTGRSFTFVDAPGLTLEAIRARVLRERAEVVFIDYLQLIEGGDKRASEYERVSQISRGILRMSKQLHITVVALSQLSRIGEYEEPELTHLRSSGQLEQDADIILMMYKPPYGEDVSEEEAADRENRRILKIAKNRKGKTGPIKLWFNGGIQRFTQQWEHFYDKPEGRLETPDPGAKQKKMEGAG